MKDFLGPIELKRAYDGIIGSIASIYNEGHSVCFAGQHGIGKSMTATNIIKYACQKNYLCLYSTLSDIVDALISSPIEEKFLARRELTLVDFLVIDEFDQRFILSEMSADLFGKTLEHIFRTRSQNKLPTIFCTNSPNPIEAFSGSIKISIESLMNNIEIIPVIGKDFRKQRAQ